MRDGLEGPIGEKHSEVSDREGLVTAGACGGSQSLAALSCGGGTRRREPQPGDNHCNLRCTADQPRAAIRISCVNDASRHGHSEGLACGRSRGALPGQKRRLGDGGGVRPLVTHSGGWESPFFAAALTNRRKHDRALSYPEIAPGRGVSHGSAGVSAVWRLVLVRRQDLDPRALIEHHLEERVDHHFVGLDH